MMDERRVSSLPIYTNIFKEILGSRMCVCCCVVFFLAGYLHIFELRHEGEGE